VQAFRKQIAIDGYSRNDFAVTLLVEKYDLDLTIDEARAQLFN